MMLTKALIFGAALTVAISNVAAAAVDCSNPGELARMIKETDPNASDAVIGGVFERLYRTLCPQGAYVPPAPAPRVTTCGWDHNGHWVCIQ
jgi:hypothetical protein